MSEQMAAPAGWYPNQYGQTQWWDGTQWGPFAPAPQQAPVHNVMPHSQVKSMGVAYCLLIFIGGTGAHCFYIGQTGRGIAMAVVLGCYFLGLVSDVEFLTYAIFPLWVMMIVDLFTLAGDVRRYNSFVMGMTTT